MVIVFLTVFGVRDPTIQIPGLRSAMFLCHFGAPLTCCPAASLVARLSHLILLPRGVYL